jgi:hypothetical protein
VTRDEAESERERLSHEHPEATWLLHEDQKDQWSVVRVNLAPRQTEDLIAETEAAERPPYPDDPRSNQARDAPYGN